MIKSLLAIFKKFHFRDCDKELQQLRIIKVANDRHIQELENQIKSLKMRINESKRTKIKDQMDIVDGKRFND